MNTVNLLKERIFFQSTLFFLLGLALVLAALITGESYCFIGAVGVLYVFSDTTYEFFQMIRNSLKYGILTFLYLFLLTIFITFILNGFVVFVLPMILVMTMWVYFTYQQIHKNDNT